MLISGLNPPRAYSLADSRIRLLQLTLQSLLCSFLNETVSFKLLFHIVSLRLQPIQECPLSDLNYFQQVYAELRNIAGRHLAHESPGQILQPTALVNEAYIKLSHGKDLKWSSHTHFLAIASKAMRQVLIDSARSAKAKKRQATMVDLTHLDVAAAQPVSLGDYLSIHETLDRLEAETKNGPRHVKLVEFVFFGGMTITEAAEHLEISRRQAQRDYKFVQAWLTKELVLGQ